MTRHAVILSRRDHNSSKAWSYLRRRPNVSISSFVMAQLHEQFDVSVFMRRHGEFDQCPSGSHSRGLCQGHFYPEFPCATTEDPEEGCQTYSAISRRVLQCELGRDRRQFGNLLPAGRVQPSAVLPITDDGNLKLSAVQNSGLRTRRTSFMNATPRSARNHP